MVCGGVADAVRRRADPIDRATGDAVASGQLLAVCGGDGELGLERGDVVGGELRSRAEPDAGCLGAGDAFGGALLDEVALELTDGGEHVEQQAAGRTASIDRLVEDDEVNLLRGDLGRDLGEVEHGAGEAVEPRHHEMVALADEGERMGERLTLVATGAAPLLWGFIEPLVYLNRARLEPAEPRIHSANNKQES